MTGMLNKQVAAELGVSEQTIKTHRRQVLHKMEVRTTTALVGLLYGVKSQRNEASHRIARRPMTPRESQMMVGQGGAISP